MQGIRQSEREGEKVEGERRSDEHSGNLFTRRVGHNVYAAFTFAYRRTAAGS